MGMAADGPLCVAWFVAALLSLASFHVHSAAAAKDSHVEARGNPYAEIEVKAGRTSKLHPLTSIANVTLWCEAKKGNTSLKIEKASFVRKSNATILEAVLDDKKMRAFHYFGLANVNESGNYTCKIHTVSGAEVEGNQQIFVRPVVFAGEMDRFDVQENEPYHFESAWVTAVRGRSINLTCPVIAFPAAKFSWKKDNKDIVEQSGHLRVITKEGFVEIQNVVDEDVGVYECTAKNEYKTDKGPASFSLVITRRLRVKGELAWLWPLLVIIVILLLLAAIIAFCECRKKRNEQKLLEGENDE